MPEKEEKEKKEEKEEKKEEIEMVCEVDEKGETVCQPEEKRKEERGVIRAEAKPALHKRIAQKGGRIAIGTLNLFLYPFKETHRRRHERFYLEKPHHKYLDLAFVILIFLLFAFNIYFWFIRPWAKPPVDLEIKSSLEKVNNFSHITFSIYYGNQGSKPLNKANLSVKLPSDFILEEIYPKKFDREKNTLSLGDLQPGANGMIKIKGKVFGEVGSSQEISATLSYKKIFVRRIRESFRYLIEGSEVKGDLSLPSLISNNFPFEFKLVLLNGSDEEIEEAEFEIDYPKNFSFIESSLEPERGSNLWKIKNFSPSEKKEILIRGKISKEEFKERSEKVQFKVKSFINFQGKRMFQGEKVRFSKIYFSKFSLKTTSSFKGNGVDLGEKIKLEINYQNQESVNIEEVKIILTPQERFFDLEKTKTKGRIEEGKIVFDSEILSELAMIEAGKGGKIDLEIPLKKYIPFSREEKNLSPKIALEASYRLSSEPTVEIKTAGEGAEYKLNSQLKISAQARYFTDEGEQLGSGPLPPMVGQVTNYWILIRVSNNLNDLENVEVVGLLPENVSWTGIKSVNLGEPIVYDPSSRRFSWFIGNLEAHRGDVLPAGEGAIRIALKPDSSDRGKILPLLIKLEIKGKDKFTGDPLYSFSGQIDTSLSFDPYASGRGRVR